MQQVATPVAQPRYSMQAVGDLSAAAGHYRTAFAGLFGGGSTADNGQIMQMIAAKAVPSQESENTENKKEEKTDRPN